jgi:hypothetical protein
VDKLPAPRPGARKKAAGVWITRARRPHRVKRRGRGFFTSPAASRNTIVHDCDRDTIGFRDFSPRLPVTTNGNVAAISGLCFARSPRAIVRRVAIGVVESLNGQVIGVAVGNGPSMEVRKRRPRFANGDAFPTVVRIARFPAPGVHVLPANMQARSGHSVRRYARSCAPARLRFAETQVCTAHNPPRAAVTYAVPKRSAARFIAGFVGHTPKPEGFGAKVYQAGILCHV